jgi:hypothetical protein
VAKFFKLLLILERSHERHHVSIKIVYDFDRRRIARKERAPCTKVRFNVWTAALGDQGK